MFALVNDVAAEREEEDGEDQEPEEEREDETAALRPRQGVCRESVGCQGDKTGLEIFVS